MTDPAPAMCQQTTPPDVACTLPNPTVISSHLPAGWVLTRVSTVYEIAIVASIVILVMTVGVFLLVRWLRRQGRARIVWIGRDGKSVQGITYEKVDDKGEINRHGATWILDAEAKLGGNYSTWIVSGDPRLGWNYRLRAMLDTLGNFLPTAWRFPSSLETLHADPILAVAATANPFSYAKREKLATIGDAARMNLEKPGVPYALLAIIAGIVVIMALGLAWYAFAHHGGG